MLWNSWSCPHVFSNLGFGFFIISSLVFYSFLLFLLLLYLFHLCCDRNDPLFSSSSFSPCLSVPSPSSLVVVCCCSSLFRSSSCFHPLTATIAASMAPLLLFLLSPYSLLLSSSSFAFLSRSSRLLIPSTLPLPSLILPHSPFVSSSFSVGSSPGIWPAVPRSHLGSCSAVSLICCRAISWPTLGQLSVVLLNTRLTVSRPQSLSQPWLGQILASRPSLGRVVPNLGFSAVTPPVAGQARLVGCLG